MSTSPYLKRLFRIDRSTAAVERAVDDELRFHFDMTVHDLMANGMTPDDARREAARRFGDVQRTRANLATIDRQRVGRERRAEWWSGVLQDLRYAARGLRLKPGFTAGVVLTLGLGVGANATMFGIVDRLLFRPPSYMKSPDRVHRLYLMRTYDGRETAVRNIAYRRYVDLSTWTTSFDATAAAFVAQLAVGTGEQARERNVGLASASFWDFFDAKPVIGRFFGADEDRAIDGTRVAVLSYGFWQSQYAGRRDVLGRKLTIGAFPYTIIGVAPSGFAGMSLETPLAFVPITAAAHDMFNWFSGGENYSNSYGLSWMEMFVRRKPGVTTAAADADLTNAYRRSYIAQTESQTRSTPIALRKPRAVAASVLVERGPQQGSDSKLALWLVGVTGIVLLVACANVANLLLARALRRRREIAVRVALGVSRARLFAQLVSESLLLAVLGGVAGLAAAQWGGGVLRAALIPKVEWTSSIADKRVLLFAAIVTVVTGLLAGLAPALHAGRTDIATALKAGSREGTVQRSRVRGALLVLQAAMSVVLLVGAGLFVRSLRNVQQIDFGFDANHLLWIGPEMRGVKLDRPAEDALRNTLVERAAAIPGVEHAARGITVPFWQTWNDDLFVAEIDSVSRLGEFKLQAVSPGYFETMGTRIVRGRPVTAEDREGTAPVMVVSESMAHVLWPRQEALGKCVRVGADTNPCRTVVGVAHDIRSGDIDSVSFHYYMPIAQFQPWRGGLYVRTRGSAASQIEVVRRELQRAMPGTSYVTVTAMSNVLAPQMRSWKLGATMFAVFGGLALLLAAIGLYSVVAYDVTQRTHEMGVRVALGAQAADVLRLVIGAGVKVAALGVLLGTGVALFAGKWLAPLLYKVSPKDPAVFATVILTLVGVATLASWLPGRRASRVDPSVALRAD
jgi:putative ABC transport system permease protein